jgi:hypothetical protein
MPAPLPRRFARTACETLVGETLVIVEDVRKRRLAEERRAFETADIRVSPRCTSLGNESAGIGHNIPHDCQAVRQ